MSPFRAPKFLMSLAGLLVGVGVVANLAYSSTALTALPDWTADLTALRASVPKMLNPALFAADESLFYASTHQYPLYPGTGAASETGVGNIVNVPLRPLSGSSQFRRGVAEVRDQRKL